MLKPKDWGNPIEEAKNANANANANESFNFLDMSAFADSDMVAEMVA